MDNDKNENVENNDEGQEWVEPPLPEEIARDESEMSEVGTILNIFLEPGRTFADLRKKPRFIIAGVIIALLTTAFAFGLQQKVGVESIRRSLTVQNEKNAQFESLAEDQKKASIDIGMTFVKVGTYASPLIWFIILLIGGLMYWLGAKVLGSEGGYSGALSVFVYSVLPPLVVATALNFLVLLLKSADDIDFMTGQRGLIKANPLAFFDGASMPVLATIVSFIDLFAIWGWILAAMGLQRVMKLSSGSAWGVILFFALIGMGIRVLFAVVGGVPS
jgi:hypothetical protein